VQKNTKSKQIKYALFTISLIVLFFGVKGIQKRFLNSSMPKKIKTLTELRADDKKKISSNFENTEEYAQAFLRLAREQDPDVHAKLEGLYKSDVKQLQYLAVRAAGQFEEKVWLERFAKIMIESEDVNARILAMQSLGSRVSQERELILQNWLKTANRQTLPFVVALESLYKVTKAEDVKKFVKTKLIEIYEEKTNPNKRVALEVLAQQLNKDPEVLELLRNIIKSAHSTDEDLQTAISTLSFLEDVWLRENVWTFTANRNVGGYITVVQSLHVLCPNNRILIMKSMLQSKIKNELLSFVLQETEKLAEPSSIEMLNEVIKDKTWTLEQLREIKKAIETLKTNAEPTRQLCRYKN
jgi:hypothetical protein